MNAVIYIILGIGAGICSGIFGIGGGVVLVPMLVYLLGFAQAEANGTSLVALLLPVGGWGAYEYYRAGKIGISHLKYGLWIAIGLFVGAYFGSRVAVHLPASVLRRSFAVLLFFVSLKLFFGN